MMTVLRLADWAVAFVVWLWLLIHPIVSIIEMLKTKG